MSRAEVLRLRRLRRAEGNVADGRHYVDKECHVPAKLLAQRFERDPRAVLDNVVEQRSGQDSCVGIPAQQINKNEGDVEAVVHVRIA
jgi:hypothetical protein